MIAVLHVHISWLKSFCQGTWTYWPLDTLWVMNNQKYLEVLKDKLPIFMEVHICQIFQQDSAPCHTARIVKQWFVETGVQLLDWLGNLPDLNPIENLWVLIKKRVAQRKCSSLKEMKEAIRDVWCCKITPQSLLLIGGVHGLKTVAGDKEQGLSNQVLTMTILAHINRIKKCSFLILSVQYYCKKLTFYLLCKTFYQHCRCGCYE